MNCFDLRNSLILLLCLNASTVWAMGKKPTLPADIAAGSPMLPTNPLTDPDQPRPGDHDYSVNVKFINHGAKSFSQDTLNRLVNAVHKIYSQCDGVNFHVNVLGITQDPATADGEDITTNLPNGNVALGDRFENFYTQFPNSPETGMITVDLMDDMSESAQNSDGYLGQALPASLMDNLYSDVRSQQYRDKPLSEVGGNTIRLGIGALAQMELNKPIMHINESDMWGNPVPVLAYLQYESSLLAHEMGHILMDPQSGKSPYIDHFCPGAGKQCGPDMLMSPGGYSDHVYLQVPQMDPNHPIGYSPLAKVEPQQCQILIHHPLVKEEN